MPVSTDNTHVPVIMGSVQAGSDLAGEGQLQSAAFYIQTLRTNRNCRQRIQGNSASDRVSHGLPEFLENIWQ